jgi:hypothetical protein
MTAEWRHVAARFHAFIAELEPTTEEQCAAWKAANQVGKLLGRRFFRPGADGLSGAGGIMVIGSYGKGTMVRGTRTTDLLFALPDRIRLDTVADAEAGPETPDTTLPPLLRDLIGLLGHCFAAVETSPHGWLTVVPGATAEDEKIAVRVLPCFVHDAGGFVVAGAGQCHTRWRHVNPRAELRHLTQIDTASGGKGRHLIRMLKAWRRVSRTEISSLALELLVSEFLRVWIYQRQSALFYDWMVRDFFFWLTAQGGRTLAVPGSRETVAIGDHWRAAAEAAYGLARLASDLERDNRDDQALVRWRGIFGLGFGCHGRPPPPPAASCRLVPWQALPLAG